MNFDLPVWLAHVNFLDRGFYLDLDFLARLADIKITVIWSLKHMGSHNVTLKL